MNELVCSNGLRISHEYETVWLELKEHRRIVIGDFYGDPKVAIFDAEEKWCAIGGCGLIIYFLEEPFESYSPQKTSIQYREFGRERPDIWWVKEIDQIGASSIRVNLETGDSHIIEITK